MNVKFLLGVALGTGAVLLIKSAYAQKIVASTGENVARGLLAAEDALNSVIESSENLRLKVIEKTHAG
jgi:hypothetical protein